MAWGDAYYGDLGSVPANNYLQGMPGELPELEDEGILTHLAKSVLLPPIQLLASTLDKPGRAIRGVLGGQGASALLNLLPFSDTLGITEPNNAPSGRDLNRQWGLADKEDTWGNWFGGLATDIITDPLNLVMFGTKNALTTLGRDALKTNTLAGTAAGRIAAKQSGLMAARTPFWWDAMGLPSGSVPLMTGKVGENIASGMGRGVDYLMHEAPYLSTPLSKLESIFRPGAGWSGDKRIAQVAGDVNAAERAAFDAAKDPTIKLTMNLHQSVQGMKQLGLPEDLAKFITNVATVGAKEGGFSKELADKSVESLLREHLPSEIADQFKRAIEGHAGDAAEHMGAVYDASKNYAGNLGKITGTNDDPWGLGYFHRQSVTGTTKRTSQQTERTIDPLALPGGTTQLNQLVSDPNFAGIANKAIPAGMSSQQWEVELAKTLKKNTDDLTLTAMAHRDEYFKKMSEGEFGMGPSEELVERMSDEAIKKSAKGLTDFIANINPDTVSKGWGYFHGDALTSTMEYTANLSRQAGQAKGNLAALARAATPAEDTLRQATNPNDFVRLSDALNDIKQNAIDQSAGNITAGGKYSLLKELSEQGKTSSSFKNWGTGVDQKVAETVLDSKVVPRDLIEAINKEVAGPGYSQKIGFGSMLDKFSSAFRSWTTVPFPAYHARNVWEGVLQQGLGGGLSPAAIRDTGKYLAGTLKDPALSAEMTRFAAEAVATGAAFRNQTMHALGESAISRDNQLMNPLVAQGNSVTEGAKDVLSRFKSTGDQTYLTLDPQRNTLVQAGVKVHNDVDNLARFSQFVALRRQGYAPEAARDAVTASQMDYSKLTMAESKLRQLIPFYAFSKQNLVRFGEQLKNPGPINTLIQGATQSGQEDYVPGYVSQGASVAMPGVTAEGKKRYISGFSLPFEDELFGAAVNLAGGHPWEAGKRALTAANPLLKLAATISSGRQIFSGRPLSEITPSPITSLGGLIPNDTANILGETISATPLGRVMSTMNAGISSKDQNLLLKLLTGVKTTDVDQQMATQMAARDAVAKALQNTGMVSTSQSYNPSKEYRDPENQPAQLQYLLQLMRALEQQSRAAAQARAQ